MYRLFGVVENLVGLADEVVAAETAPVAAARVALRLSHLIDTDEE